MSSLRITYKKSSIGYPANQKATIRALGLRKIRQTIEQTDNPQIRGMIHTVRHLIEVEEVN
ncbi:MAG TPA: 50S ribosomal protein L30 [Dehalococcoidia bacterium]|jgi:large subunit ribosomal protein L30|nr:50S ribosomal protein L30 [Dehalococcoidia bacterium]